MLTLDFDWAGYRTFLSIIGGWVGLMSVALSAEQRSRLTSVLDWHTRGHRGLLRAFRTVNLLFLSIFERYYLTPSSRSSAIPASAPDDECEYDEIRTDQPPDARREETQVPHGLLRAGYAHEGLPSRPGLNEFIWLFVVIGAIISFWVVFGFSIGRLVSELQNILRLTLASSFITALLAWLFGRYSSRGAWARSGHQTATRRTRTAASRKCRFPLLLLVGEAYYAIVWAVHTKRPVAASSVIPIVVTVLLLPVIAFLLLSDRRRLAVTKHLRGCRLALTKYAASVAASVRAQLSRFFGAACPGGSVFRTGVIALFLVAVIASGVFLFDYEFTEGLGTARDDVSEPMVRHTLNHDILLVSARSVDARLVSIGLVGEQAARCILSLPVMRSVHLGALTWSVLVGLVAGLLCWYAARGAARLPVAALTGLLAASSDYFVLKLIVLGASSVSAADIVAAIGFTGLALAATGYVAARCSQCCGASHSGWSRGTGSLAGGAVVESSISLVRFVGVVAVIVAATLLLWRFDLGIDLAGTMGVTPLSEESWSLEHKVLGIVFKPTGGVFWRLGFVDCGIAIGAIAGVVAGLAVAGVAGAWTGVAVGLVAGFAGGMTTYYAVLEILQGGAKSVLMVSFLASLGWSTVAYVATKSSEFRRRLELRQQMMFRWLGGFRAWVILGTSGASIGVLWLITYWHNPSIAHQFWLDMTGRGLWVYLVLNVIADALSTVETHAVLRLAGGPRSWPESVRRARAGRLPWVQRNQTTDRRWRPQARFGGHAAANL